MLTDREIEVLELTKKGLKQADIARKLKISQPAVSNFYNNAVGKLKDAEETIKLKKKMRIE